MTYHRTTINSVALVAGLALWLGAAAPAKALELSYSYWANDKSAVASTMKWWADEVKKQTDGEVTVKIFWRQALVKFKNNYKGVKSGQADIAELAAAFSMANMPAWALADTGSGSADSYVTATALDNMRGKFPVLDAEFDKAGLKYLWHYSWGGVVLLGKGKPIVEPSQFNGENVRVSSFLASAIRDKGWKANPVQISIADMLQGLERGTVQGGSNYWSSLPRFAKVIDWVSVINQGQHTGVVVMNSGTWKALSPKAKKAINGLRSEMMLRLARSQAAEKDKIRTMLAGKGVKVIQASGAQSAIWGDGMKNAFIKRAKKLNSKFPEGAAFRAAYKAEIAKVAAEVKENGYPWK